MEYLKVRWVHKLDNEPIVLFSELSASRDEIRKVEVYADGRHDYAGPDVATGTTALSEGPLPPLDEIAADPQFVPVVIDQDEFENVWRRAIQGGPEPQGEVRRSLMTR